MGIDAGVALERMGRIARGLASRFSLSFGPFEGSERVARGEPMGPFERLRNDMFLESSGRMACERALAGDFAPLSALLESGAPLAGMRSPLGSGGGNPVSFALRAILEGKAPRDLAARIAAGKIAALPAMETLSPLDALAALALCEDPMGLLRKSASARENLRQAAKRLARESEVAQGSVNNAIHGAAVEFARLAEALLLAGDAAPDLLEAVERRAGRGGIGALGREAAFGAGVVFAAFGAPVGKGAGKAFALLALGVEDPARAGEFAARGPMSLSPENGFGQSGSESGREAAVGLLEHLGPAGAKAFCGKLSGSWSAEIQPLADLWLQAAARSDAANLEAAANPGAPRPRGPRRGI